MKSVVFAVALALSAWSLSPSPVEAAGEITGAFCKGAYAEYQEKQGPRAFAISADGSACGTATTNSCNRGTQECLRAVAVAYCDEYGDNCTVYESQE